MLHPFKIVVFYICCFFVASLNSAGHTTLVVGNQAEFDGLQEKLTSAIESGKKNIYVSLLPGTYIAREKHITLKDINAADTKIRIVGHGATLIPEGREYHDGEAYEGTFSVGNSWMCGNKDVETWSYVRYADSLIEILDAEEKRCRLKCKNSFPDDTDFSNAYILITHWFRSSVYKIDNLENQYIYFTADDLKESYYSGYNVNDDYNYGKVNPRYKLCNVETGDDCLRITNGKVCLPVGMMSVREGKIQRYITIKDCKFHSLEISGIKFFGNSLKESNSAIYLKDNECESLQIHDCEFRGFRSSVVTSKASRNVIIANNVFSDCHFSGIQSDNASEGTIVKGNSFSSMGKRMTNSFCVICHGADYQVKNNAFVDFGFGGVGVGVWYKGAKKYNCSGVVEHNELKYSNNYVADIANHAIMDNGAIYLWTKNDGSIIRYNYINNFSGIKHNCGIFCDDGAYNYKLIGNVITGNVNNYCIDARRDARVEEVNTPGSGIDRSNVNIVIKDNIVNGKIRVVGNEIQNNGCVLGNTYFLLLEKSKLPKNTIDKVNVIGENVILNYLGEKNGYVVLSAKSIRQLKKSPFWNEVKKYMVRRTFSCSQY